MSWRALPGAPEPGTALCRADEVGEGNARVFTFGGGARRFEMFLLRREGRLMAYVNACPHQGTPLDLLPGHFYNRDKTLLICRTHGARFRPDDGFCVRGPCDGESLVPVAVAERDGEVVLEGR